jgi:hypothetical protein
MGRTILVFLIFVIYSSCQSSSGTAFNRQGQLIFTRHARCRMDCRHITVKEIHEILDNGSINYAKSEPNATPDPKWAMEGFTNEHQHLRIIIAPEGEKLIVITCIELGVEWECDCN